MTKPETTLKRGSDGPAAAGLKIYDSARLKVAAAQNVPVICADYRPSTQDWPSLADSAHFQFAISYGIHKNFDLLLAEVEQAVVCGASSVYCVSHPDVIEKLATRGIPVFAHTGLVPQICTGAGGLRAVGKKPIEAERIRNTVQRFADSGAIGVYLQLVPEELATEVTQNTDLVTVSVGSGGGCDVTWAHAEDILGENPAYVPRHAKIYANPTRTDSESCIKQYLSDVRTGNYPGSDHVVTMG